MLDPSDGLLALGNQSNHWLSCAESALQWNWTFASSIDAIIVID